MRVVFTGEFPREYIRLYAATVARPTLDATLRGHRKVRKHFVNNETYVVYHCLLAVLMYTTLWRNGSAFDSRSKGYLFKSGVAHFRFFGYF